MSNNTYDLGSLNGKKFSEMTEEELRHSINEIVKLTSEVSDYINAHMKQFNDLQNLIAEFNNK